MNESMEISFVGDRATYESVQEKTQSFSAVTHYPNINSLISNYNSQYRVVIVSQEKLTRKAIRRIKERMPNIAIVALLNKQRSSIPSDLEIRPSAYIDLNLSNDAIQINLAAAAKASIRQSRLNSLTSFLFSQSSATCETLRIISDATKAATLPANFHDMTKSLALLLQRIGADKVSLVFTTETGQTMCYESNDDSSRIDFEISGARDISALDKFKDKLTLLHANDCDSPIKTISSTPWAHVLVFKYVLQSPNRSDSQTFYILGYRSSLDGFTEQEVSIAEIMHPIFGLGLEKVGFINYNLTASRDWSNTFDSISEPISIINKNYEIIRANKAFARAVGKRMLKLPGRKCYSLLSQRRSKCQHCLPLSHPGSSIPAQVSGRRNQKFYVWAYPIKTGSKDIQRIHFYRNISVEHQLATTLIRSERMKAVGDLLTAISHEINNPLTGILATAQVLINEHKSNSHSSELVEDLSEIESSALRSLEIIENLLGFGNNSDDSLCTVSEGIESAIKFSKSSLRAVDLKLRVNPALQSVTIPKSSFQQILFNVITNASNAMGEKGCLEISAESDIKSFEVRLSDNGKGMTKETLEQIFEPFFTQRNKGKGTGLGMVIVKDLVTRLNGSIKVDSSVGKGTTVRLKFPAALEMS